MSPHLSEGGRCGEVVRNSAGDQASVGSNSCTSKFFVVVHFTCMISSDPVLIVFFEFLFRFVHSFAYIFLIFVNIIP